ncbi:hypothetical protein F383_34079 [Gossypium arboreum]|uniref:Uncharacterized protein n=1 Tax=Gossypium arboreum TaxID=29729 RepID=A0A0B0N8I5_GOSAR|nr:hypothetical protein F383_34079 [Gossypium arboreum]
MLMILSVFNYYMNVMIISCSHTNLLSFIAYFVYFSMFYSISKLAWLWGLSETSSHYQTFILVLLKLCKFDI